MAATYTLIVTDGSPAWVAGTTSLAAIPAGSAEGLRAMVSAGPQRGRWVSDGVEWSKPGTDVRVEALAADGVPAGAVVQVYA